MKISFFSKFIKFIFNKKDKEKICLNCIYCEKDENLRYYCCKRFEKIEPRQIDIVTGKVFSPETVVKKSCHSCREFESFCGRKAKYFKHRKIK